MRENATKLLQHSQELCLNFEKIFDELSTEFNKENLFKKNQVSVKDFFSHEEGQHISDYFFDSDGIIKGFRMIVAADGESYRRYLHICEKLEIDARVPMFMVCAVIKPVSKPKNCIEHLNSIIDVCCGFIDENDEQFDWANFDEVKDDIAFDSIIALKNKQWTKEEETQYDYPAWNNYFSEAKIKIVDIFSITDRGSIENLANEIKQMTA